MNWQRERDRLLRAAGFRDIESPGGMLARDPGRDVADDEIEAADAATEALRTHRFASPRDREVWRAHAQGKSAREMSRERGWCRTKTAARVTRIATEIKTSNSRPVSVRKLIEESDPRLLVALLVALGR